MCQYRSVCKKVGDKCKISEFKKKKKKKVRGFKTLSKPIQSINAKNIRKSLKKINNSFTLTGSCCVTP